MRSSLWIIPLGVVLVAVLILGLGVIFLSHFVGGSTQDEGDAPSEVLLGAGAESEDRAALRGRGVRPGEAPDAAPTTGPATPENPAEVSGTTPGGAAVRGRVVRGGGRIPVAGACVRLRRPDSIFTYARASVNGRFDELEARTAADGRFAFFDVTPSDGYVVRAFLEPHAAASTREELDLRGRESVDVGDLVLDAGGAVKGRVVGEDGGGVPGVDVAVTWRVHNAISMVLADSETLPEIEATQRTDAQGAFLFEALEPGPKTLVIQAPSGASEVVQSVEVEAGRTSDAGGIVLVGDLALAGVVVWADDRPVEGARVFAKPMSGPTGRTVETGDDGLFRLERLPEGVYGVGVLVPGLPLKLQMPLQAGREDLRFVLPVPGGLCGRVVYAKSEKPVERFAVLLRPEETEAGWERYIQRPIDRVLGSTPFVDATGAFAFPRVAPGTYTLEVSGSGFPSVEYEGVVVVGGQTTDDVVIELPEGNVICGRVRRANGAPVAEVRLYVFLSGAVGDVEAVHLREALAHRQPDAASDAQGAFVLPPLTPGRYDVIAVHVDSLPAVLKGVDLLSGDADDVEIRLPPSGGLRGSLVDAYGQPVTDEQVVVLWPDGTVRLESVDSRGRFEIRGLPVGPCVARWLSMQEARRYAGALKGSDVEKKREVYDELRQDGGEDYVSDGEMTSITLRVPRRVRVRGRITLQGEPPTQVRTFWLVVPGSGVGVSIECDEDGRYERDVEPGSYQVWVPFSGDEWRPIPVEIPDVPTHTLDLDVP